MKSIFIIVGAVTLGLLIFFWIYLLFFGTPERVQNVFTDLGIGGNTEFTPSPFSPETKQLGPVTGKLTELTTKPVAGFVYIDTAEAATTSTSSIPAKLGRLRYSERGTGHIYEISFADNVEERVSGTTVGKTIDAIFNQTGQAGVIVAEKGDTTTATLSAFGANGTKIIDLPERSSNFFFPAPDKLRYGVTDDEGTTAYELDWEDDTTTELWHIPFTDIDIKWTASSTLVINRPAPFLKGGVFEIVNGGLKRIIEPRYNLSAATSHNGRLLYSFFEPGENVTRSFVSDPAITSFAAASLRAIPEKCTYVARTGFWCAASSQLREGANRDSLTAWYRGEFVSSDSLWKESSRTGNATYVDDLSKLAGFDIDVTDLTASADGKLLFFRNKINDTLWMYRIEE